MVSEYANKAQTRKLWNEAVRQELRHHRRGEKENLSETHYGNKMSGRTAMRRKQTRLANDAFSKEKLKKKMNKSKNFQILKIDR